MKTNWMINHLLCIECDVLNSREEKEKGVYSLCTRCWSRLFRFRSSAFFSMNQRQQQWLLSVQRASSSMATKSKKNILLLFEVFLNFFFLLFSIVRSRTNTTRLFVMISIWKSVQSMDLTLYSAHATTHKHTQFTTTHIHNDVNMKLQYTC